MGVAPGQPRGSGSVGEDNGRLAADVVRAQFRGARAGAPALLAGASAYRSTYLLCTGGGYAQNGRSASSSARVRRASLLTGAGAEDAGDLLLLLPTLAESGYPVGEHANRSSSIAIPPPSAEQSSADTIRPTGST
jgi:hypothetical protein